jgi:hypothetical protein
LSTPTTAEVDRCGSRSLHGSERGDEDDGDDDDDDEGECFFPDWGAAGVPARVVDLPPPPPASSFPRTSRSDAMRLNSGLPSNILILWQPLCQSCPRRGVASYLQSPGRVSWEWGSTSVIGPAPPPPPSPTASPAPPPPPTPAERRLWWDIRPMVANSRSEERRIRKDLSLWVVVVHGGGAPPPPPSPPRGGTIRGTIATACMAESRNEGRPGSWLRADDAAVIV